MKNLVNTSFIDEEVEAVMGLEELSLAQYIIDDFDEAAGLIEGDMSYARNRLFGEYSFHESYWGLSKWSHACDVQDFFESDQGQDFLLYVVNVAKNKNHFAKKFLGHFAPEIIRARKWRSYKGYGSLI